MATPIYDTDVVTIADRTPVTSLETDDVFVVSDTSTGKLAPITKANVKATLGINTNTTAIGNLAGTGRTTETVKGNAEDIATLNADDATEGSVAKTVKDAVEPVKGIGWTDENLVDHETRIDTLEGYTKVSLGQETVDVVFDGNTYSKPLLVTSDEGVLFDLDNKLVKYSKSMDVEWEKISIRPRDIAEDSSGNFWCTLSTGVYVIDSEGLDVTSFTTSDFLEATGIAIDADGNILTTHYTSVGKNLIKWQPDGTELWSKTNILDGIDVIIDNEGNIWAGGYSITNNLSKFQPDGTVIYENIRAYNISLAVDDMNNLYVSSYNGTAKYSKTGSLIWFTSLISGYSTSYTKLCVHNYNLYGVGGNRYRKLDRNGELIWQTEPTATSYYNSLITNGNGLVYGGRNTTASQPMRMVQLREYNPINWRG